MDENLVPESCLSEPNTVILGAICEHLQQNWHAVLGFSRRRKTPLIKFVNRAGLVSLELIDDEDEGLLLVIFTQEAGKRFSYDLEVANPQMFELMDEYLKCLESDRDRALNRGHQESWHGIDQYIHGVDRYIQEW